MPKRSATADHIIKRVEQARRKDPNLTWKKAAKELGISESSLMKMKAGTRSGQGSIKRKLIDRPTWKTGRPQSVANSFNIQFRSGDGSRAASRNVYIHGAYDEADALAWAHDPKTKNYLKKQLRKEAKDRFRRDTGSAPWTSKQIDSLEVVGISRVVYGQKPHMTLDFKL